MTTANLKNDNRTTAIGSLPHHNIDSALAFSFEFGIPFLPQIPIRNAWEFMIAQALEGLPGLQLDETGSVTIRAEIWESRAHSLSQKLELAFSDRPESPQILESFEPSPATSSSWQPFLWELSERGVKTAKIQIAGPLTSQWAVRLKDGTPLERIPELSSQIYKLVLAKSLAMCMKLKSQGVSPILYLDEPALYCLDLKNPRHWVAYQELKLLVQALQKQDVKVGIHCCSNTDWGALLKVGIDILSIDSDLSLKSLLSEANLSSVEEFLASGGRLSLGVIPTQGTHTDNPSPSFEKTEALFSGLLATLHSTWPKDPARVSQVLRQSLFTPACGLALQNVAYAEFTLGALQGFNHRVQEYLAQHG